MPSSDKILFLDASSPTVHVGILCNGKWLGYFRSEEPALQSLFQGVEVCLQAAQLKLKDITHFAYCEGPGSLLGIRLAAMAIQGWKQQEIFKDSLIYAYNSFEVGLALIDKVHQPKQPYAVVSQSRKGYWNILKNDGNSVNEVAESELESKLDSLPGGLWVFKQRKLSPLPPDQKDSQKMAFDYSLEDHPEIFIDSGTKNSLLRLVDHPDALIIRESEYAKWDSKRHSSMNKEV